MPPVGFEPTISPGERPKTYALDRAATGTGVLEGVVRVNTKSGVKLYIIIYENLSNLSVMLN